MPSITVMIFLVTGNWVIRALAQTPTWPNLVIYGTVITLLFSSTLYFYFSAEEKVRIKNLLSK
jgi:hypothetical protein